MVLSRSRVLVLSRRPGAAGPRHARRRRVDRHRDQLRQQQARLQPEQGERALGRHRPGAPEHPRRGRQRQRRLRGVQRRRPDELPLHRRRRGVRDLVLDRSRGHVDLADVYAVTRRGPASARPSAFRTRAGRSARCPGTTRTGWSPSATRRWPSGPSRTIGATSRGRTARGCTTPTSQGHSPATRASKARTRSPCRGRMTSPARWQAPSRPGCPR